MGVHIPSYIPLLVFILVDIIVVVIGIAIILSLLLLLLLLFFVNAVSFILDNDEICSTFLTMMRKHLLIFEI